LKNRLIITVSDVNGTKSYNIHQLVKKLAIIITIVAIIVISGSIWLINYLNIKMDNLKIAKEKEIEILGDIIAKTTQKSLEQDVGNTFEVVVEGESDEHELLLSARKLMWEREIDGEIYINDNELSNPIEFGKTYKAKITKLVGDKLMGTIIEAV
jgi:hypothetical protein